MKSFAVMILVLRAWGTIVRVLWRSKHCQPDRWRYMENPCKCYGHPHGGVSLREHFNAGYTREWVEAERGSWRRDSNAIGVEIDNTWKRNLRATMWQQIAKHAVGPREPALMYQGTPIYALDVEHPKYILADAWFRNALDEFLNKWCDRP